MDFPKIEGIVQAIEAEAKAPAPSHQNLARLVSMAFRELLGVYEVPKTEAVTVSNQDPAFSVVTFDETESQAKILNEQDDNK